MIYRINITTDKNKKLGGKEFYLTADSTTQLYKRAKTQYGVDPQFVNIMEEIDENSIDINIDKNKKVGAKKESAEQISNNLDLNEANQLLAKAYKITDAEKERLLLNWKPIELDQSVAIASQVAEKLKLKHTKAKLYLTKNKDNGKYEYLLLFK